MGKQFSRGPLGNGAIPVNAPVRANTKDLLEKAGWSFVEWLRDGLLIAPTPNLVVKDCAFGTRPTALAGSKTLVVGNGTLRSGMTDKSVVPPVAGAQPSCSISVDVTASTANLHQHA